MDGVSKFPVSWLKLAGDTCSLIYSLKWWMYIYVSKISSFQLFFVVAHTCRNECVLVFVVLSLLVRALRDSASMRLSWCYPTEKYLENVSLCSRHSCYSNVTDKKYLAVSVLECERNKSQFFFFFSSSVLFSLPLILILHVCLFTYTAVDQTNQHVGRRLLLQQKQKKTSSFLYWVVCSCEVKKSPGNLNFLYWFTSILMKFIVSCLWQLVVKVHFKVYILMFIIFGDSAHQTSKYF